MILTRKRVRRLNALPELTTLNRVHAGEHAAQVAFKALIDAAGDREGVDVMATTPQTGNYHHTLEVDGELADDSVLVRQVYAHETGRVEVIAYFS